MAGFPDATALLARVTAEAVLNSLWQGMALAGLTWLLLRWSPRNPAMRYAAWYACLAGVLLLPATHVIAHMWAAVPSESKTIIAPAAGASVPELLPAEGALKRSHPWPTLAVSAGTATVLVLAWASIALLLGTRLALSYKQVARLKKNSKPMDDPATRYWASGPALRHTRRHFEVRSSEQVRLPMLAGLAKPAILFPLDLVPRLSTDQKSRICLHELAHIRRWDDWTILFQRIIEAVMFFHPAVRLIGRRLCLERELACDDWVVTVSGSARPYAACLVRLAELASLRSQPTPVLGLAGSRKQIQRRIEMLLNPKRSQRSTWSRVAFLAVILACLAATAAAARMSPVILIEDPPASLTSPPASPAPPESPAPPAQAAKPAPPAEPQAPSTREKEPRRAEQAPDMTGLTKAQQEEIQRLTEEIRKEVETGIRAKTEEIRKLADQIGEKVRASIQPQVREISELAGKLAKEQSASKPDQDLIRKLEEDIRQHEAEIDRVSEQEVKALEQQIHVLEEAIRPSEEQIRKFETRIREVERDVRVKEREVRPGRDRNVPPPAPPAPPPPPPPPPPPDK